MGIILSGKEFAVSPGEFQVWIYNCKLQFVITRRSLEMRAKM